jgi:hypothetical protein
MCATSAVNRRKGYLLTKHAMHALLIISARAWPDVLLAGTAYSPVSSAYGLSGAAVLIALVLRAHRLA